MLPAFLMLGMAMVEVQLTDAYKRA
jgi:hypothetical protein